MARVVASPAGVGEHVFTMPYSAEEVAQFALGLTDGRRQMVAGQGLATSQRLKDFGGTMFDAVVQGQVRDCYYRSRDASTREGRGLRIKLRLDGVPSLADLPWEFLYDRTTNQFLALSDFSPIVRHLGLPGPVAPLAVKPPLRILAAIASPTTTAYADLESDAEWTRLSAALSRLVQTGKVQLELLKPATLGELQRRLRRGEYHVLHFIGHGGFEVASGLGMLVFEDDSGRDHLVEGERFANVVCDHRSLRLAFLNCCEGTRASPTSPFTGVAQALLQKGVPAVVAMQFEVTDVAALALGETFYEALADGCDVDTALGGDAQGALCERERGRVGHAGPLPAVAGRAALRHRGDGARRRRRSNDLRRAERAGRRYDARQPGGPVRHRWSRCRQRHRTTERRGVAVARRLRTGGGPLARPGPRIAQRHARERRPGGRVDTAIRRRGADRPVPAGVRR